jgi:hypothetical protein
MELESPNEKEETGRAFLLRKQKAYRVLERIPGRSIRLELDICNITPLP